MTTNNNKLIINNKVVYIRLLFSSDIKDVKKI